MSVSVFDLFSIGIGPSSSHTVGPMRAAKRFALALKTSNHLDRIDQVVVQLYGSLALTGKGHATDLAITLGLYGFGPEQVEPEQAFSLFDQTKQQKKLSLLGQKQIAFDPAVSIEFHMGHFLPYHSNALRFKAFSKGKIVLQELFYSVGGGFIVTHKETQEPKEQIAVNYLAVPYPFETFSQLEALCKEHMLSVDELVMANELALETKENVRKGILEIWDVMKRCVKRGCTVEGILPGGLGVVRRAPKMYQELTLREEQGIVDPGDILDWTSMFALAVNEENAAGSKVVTSPTNGASGVIPAVLHYYEKFIPQFSEEGVIRFFLVATAIGILYKFGASLSAAEMGCQGEVGVASSMAAAGLTAALGGDLSQIENAAEIAMEHHLGLTCDPIGGLVQIPCIERNTMGAIKAINASRLALRAKGQHKVRLDEVISAMRDIGKDMHSNYKETSIGGLAAYVPVNLPEC